MTLKIFIVLMTTTETSIWSILGILDLTGSSRRKTRKTNTGNGIEILSGLHRLQVDGDEVAGLDGS
jgi:hypothetical protein